MVRYRLAAVLVFVLTLVLVTPVTLSTAAVRSAALPTTHISIRLAAPGGTTSSPSAIPDETVGLSGSVAPSRPPRVVVVQQFRAHAWHEVTREPMNGGTWNANVFAPAPGRYSYRAVALRTALLGVGVSATTVLTVLRPSVTMSAPRTVEAGRLLTVTGAATPTRAGGQVQLWQLRGPRWVAVANSVQGVTGAYRLRVRAGRLGANTYRVVTGPTLKVRSPVSFVQTVPAATAGTRFTYLADVNPLRYPSLPGYGIGTYTIAGRQYPKSVHIAGTRFSYELGAGASTFGAAISLLPVTRDRIANRGPRLIDVSVDGRVRLRRFVKDGQALPLILDVRGGSVISIQSRYAGPGDDCCGSDVLLGTPVVTSAVRAERSVDPGRVLSDLRPIAVSSGLLTNQVVDSTYRTLYGGSLRLDGSSNDSYGPGGDVKTGYADYALGGAFRQLTGVPGVAGEVQTNVTGSVRVYGDGLLLATWPAGFARDQVAVGISGVQRLRVELVADQPPNAQSLLWYVMLGDPRLE